MRTAHSAGPHIGRDNIPTIFLRARLSQSRQRGCAIRGQTTARQHLECVCFSTAFPSFSQTIRTAAVHRRTPDASRNSSSAGPHPASRVAYPACRSYQHPPILVTNRPLSTAPLALLATFKEYFQKSHFLPSSVAKALIFDRCGKLGLLRLGR